MTVPMIFYTGDESSRMGLNARLLVSKTLGSVSWGRTAGSSGLALCGLALPLFKNRGRGRVERPAGLIDPCVATIAVRWGLVKLALAIDRMGAKLGFGGWFVPSGFSLRGGFGSWRGGVPGGLTES
jgi:hypothetical protein